jgi:sodium/potassium/calcium exchanger 6
LVTIIFQIPIMVALTLTIPVVDSKAPDKNWKRLLAAVQLLIAPVFLVWAFDVDELELDSAAIEDTITVGGAVFPLWAVALGVGSVAATVLLLVTTNDTPPKRFHLFSFLSFLVAVAWISIIADEIVAILETIGVVRAPAIMLT